MDSLFYNAEQIAQASQKVEGRILAHIGRWDLSWAELELYYPYIRRSRASLLPLTGSDHTVKGPSSVSRTAAEMPDHWPRAMDWKAFNMTLDDLWVVMVVILAGLIHGLIGLGFPMVATPLISLTSDVRSAIVILLLPTMAVNLINIVRGGDWKQSIGRFWLLAIFGAMGSLMGTQVLVYADPKPFKLVMAAVIFIYLAHHRTGIRMQWIQRHPMAASAIFGTIGGLLAGTVNVMVPALIIFALEMGLTPLVTVQLFNFCFLVGKFCQGVILTSHGYLGGEQIAASLPLAAAAMAALCVGIRFRDRIDPEMYRNWLRKALAAIAILLAVQYFGAA